MLKPLQNAAQDSKVMESLAYVVLANARPVVDSVKHPWNAHAPLAILCLICKLPAGGFGFGAGADVGAEPPPAVGVELVRLALR